jgi:transcriptional regulator with XRE-family HTH domain
MKNTNVQKQLGKQVREIRTAQGYSQESLADAAGLHRTYIGAIERGEQNVSIENVARIANSLDVKIAELFKKL